jgi:hypothetical protein
MPASPGRVVRAPHRRCRRQIIRRLRMMRPRIDDDGGRSAGEQSCRRASAIGIIVPRPGSALEPTTWARSLRRSRASGRTPADAHRPCRSRSPWMGGRTGSNRPARSAPDTLLPFVPVASGRDFSGDVMTSSLGSRWPRTVEPAT